MMNWYRKKEKTTRYATGEELMKIKERTLRRIENLQEKQDKLTKKYIAIAQRKKETGKGSLKQILKLSKAIQKTKNQITNLEYDLKLIEEKRYVKESLFARFKKWFSSIPYSTQKIIWGIIFVIPWVIGISLFFIPPFIRTIWWSFHKVSPGQDGLTVEFNGIKNYIYLFQEYTLFSTNFRVEFVNFFRNVAIDLPIIIIFSILMAVLLNSKFKGQTLVKALFFIPVVYNMSIINATVSRAFGAHLQESTFIDFTITQTLTQFFYSIGIGVGFIETIIQAVERIFTIVNYSGIQILIFVAALQSIPKHLYEAAKVEGASAYESFWKITIPMVTPVIITAAIYTIIDIFTRAPIYAFLEDQQSKSNYGNVSAIAVTYFGLNLFVILIVYLILKGLVFYYDER